MIPSDALATGKKLLEKATKGPWIVQQQVEDNEPLDTFHVRFGNERERDSSVMDLPDAEFIAWSREGVAQLIADNERLREVIVALDEVVVKLTPELERLTQELKDAQRENGHSFRLGWNAATAHTDTRWFQDAWHVFWRDKYEREGKPEDAARVERERLELERHYKAQELASLVSGAAPGETEGR